MEIPLHKKCINILLDFTSEWWYNQGEVRDKEKKGSATMAKNLKEVVRVQYMNLVRSALEANGEDVLDIASNAFCFPVVDSEGNDLYIRVKVEIPKGSKDEPFDGYAMRDDYTLKCAEKAAKAEKAKAEKAKKIERDKKQREVAARIKAEKAKANAK